VVVVSNSSPLIYLAALGDFELLPQLFGEIHIPTAVGTEIVEQGMGFPVQPAALQAVAHAWLRVMPLRLPMEAIHAESRRLHQGEVEVIRLAEQLSADTVLMDDRAAVIQARSQGFLVVPTIAIYIEAKRKGMIGGIKEKVDQLRAARFRLSERELPGNLGSGGRALEIRPLFQGRPPGHVQLAGKRSPSTRRSINPVLRVGARQYHLANACDWCSCFAPACRPLPTAAQCR